MIFVPYSVPKVYGKESEKMQKIFNVTGVCVPTKHYMVDISSLGILPHGSK